MESKVKFAGHPVHPMLIVFPLGLLATAVIFDIIYLVSSNPQWTLVSHYMIGAGIIGGWPPRLFGWLDWFAIPSGTRAKRIGLLAWSRQRGGSGIVHPELGPAAGDPSVPPTGAIVAGLGGVVICADHCVAGWGAGRPAGCRSG